MVNFYVLDLMINIAKFADMFVTYAMSASWAAVKNAASQFWASNGAWITLLGQIVVGLAVLALVMFLLWARSNDGVQSQTEQKPPQ
jgi:hypothetical protein